MMRNVTTYPTTHTKDIRQERLTPLYIGEQMEGRRTALTPHRMALLLNSTDAAPSLSSDSPLNGSTALDSTVGALLVGTFIGVM